MSVDWCRNPVPELFYILFIKRVLQFCILPLLSRFNLQIHLQYYNYLIWWKIYNWSCFIVYSAVHFPTTTSLFIIKNVHVYIFFTFFSSVPFCFWTMYIIISFVWSIWSPSFRYLWVRHLKSYGLNLKCQNCYEMDAFSLFPPFYFS